MLSYLEDVAIIKNSPGISNIAAANIIAEIGTDLMICPSPGRESVPEITKVPGRRKRLSSTKAIPALNPCSARCRGLLPINYWSLSMLC
jgi:hypothetical protein